MTFEEFYNRCSFDISEDLYTGEPNVTAIFSTGMRRQFSKEFVKEHTDVAKRLVAEDLYNYTRKAME